jgi:hypothetical protein
VGVQIDGDHMAVVVWRGRVHLFWVTFLEQAGKPNPGAHSSDNMSQLTLGQLVAMQSPIQVKVQLNWTEQFQGEWSEPTCSGFLTAPMPDALLSRRFSREDEFIHASVADDGAVWVHLTGYLNWALRLVSRNAAPTIRTAQSPVRPPFADLGSGSRWRHDGTADTAGLDARYSQEITTKDGTTTYSCPTIHEVLGKGSEYELVAHASALSGMPYDVGGLVVPFFYADEHHTFYVEPTLTEKTIEDSDGFILYTPVIAKEYDKPVYRDIEVDPHVPIGPRPLEEIALDALFQLSVPQDWATREGAVVQFGTAQVGKAGGIETGGITSKGQP